MNVAGQYLVDVRERMRGLKKLGEGAMAQLRDDEWHLSLSPDGNSAAVLIYHLSSNMHLCWGAFRHGLTTFAAVEVPGQNRDGEWTEDQQTSFLLWGEWENGWQVFLSALDQFTSAVLTADLTIQGETHTVLQVIQREIAHTSGHVYQLIFLVKTLRGPDWQPLSIGPGASAAVNRQMMGEG